MTAGTRGYLNNFSTTVDESLSDSDTTITVADATGISTVLASYTYIALTIDDGTNVEIVHCTGVTSNDLTVVRGQEGTSGTAFASGTPIECRLTAYSILNKALWEVVDFEIFSGTATSKTFAGLAGRYRLTINVSFDTDNDYLLLRVGTGGGPTIDTGNNYRYSKTQNTSDSTTPAVTASNSISYFQMFDLVYGGGGTANTLYGSIEFSALDNTSYYKNAHWVWVQNDFNSPNHISRESRGSGTYVSTTAVTAIQVLTNGGNFNTGSLFVLERMRDLT